MLYSDHCVIENSTVTGNKQEGIWLWYSGNNLLSGNVISENRYDFGAFGDELGHFDNIVHPSNTVHGRGIMYLVGARNQLIEGDDIGAVYLIDCMNITVQGLALANNGQGVFLFNVTNSRIENVSSQDSSYGIYLQRSNNNSIVNSLCRNDWVGLCLQESNLNLIDNDEAAECEKGLSLYQAYNNTIQNNAMVSNTYGIRLFSSDFNLVFHNNFIGNSKQVDQLSSGGNTWDNGCEGNYWSGYNGTDSDRDGVGDTDLLAETVDNYPLLSPYLVGDIDHDGRTSILDVVRISISFLSTPSDLSWNPHADVTKPYGDIDMKDISITLSNYGVESEFYTMSFFGRIVNVV